MRESRARKQVGARFDESTVRGLVAIRDRLPPEACEGETATISDALRIAVALGIPKAIETLRKAETPQVKRAPLAKAGRKGGGR